MSRICGSLIILQLFDNLEEYSVYATEYFRSVTHQIFLNIFRGATTTYVNSYIPP